MTVADQPGAPGGVRRWVIYQRERFPVLAHGAMIFAFSSGAVCYSALLRAHQAGRSPDVAPSSLAVAFVSSLLFFFQLRVADEHKDFDDDLRWRPYRPVPRGLVTLRELSTLGVVSMAIQLALALWLTPRLVVALALVWGYMGLMRKEFWLREQLRARPVTTLWTHMLVVPFIDFYATACDWLVSSGWHAPTIGLIWFLVASFCNGIVVEVGRKVRADEDEEEGVETYSRLWGRRRAVVVWLAAMLSTAICALLAVREVGAMPIVAWPLGALGVVSAAAGWRLARTPRPGAGKHLEILSGVWTMAMYLSVGVVPFLFAR